PAERLEHRLRPLSAGVAVPLFALAAAGVTVTGGLAVFADPVAVGVVVGLVAGKTVGVLLGGYLTARWTRAELSPELEWRDIAGVSMLSGVGFTVSLLIAELAFPADRAATAKAGVLAGSLVAAGAAAVMLRARHHAYRRLAARPAEEPADEHAGEDIEDPDGDTTRDVSGH
ncbi:MAG: Na+/H+ antiporter NhaA, partial [Actinomycetota bacterium]|nr:Na+/H+ antiporter NhaA [Actinomycetota bacterium]